VPKVVVSHEEIPADRMLLHGIDTSAGPIFTVSEVAKIFFCRSSHWLRLQEYKGLYLDGQKVEPARAGKTEVRQYTLTDVENLAHALAQDERISADQLMRALHAVRGIAMVWVYL